jgi:ketol-acid reductoisomerase
MRAAAQHHPIEQVGAELRAMMPWLRKGRAPVPTAN